MSQAAPADRASSAREWGAAVALFTVAALWLGGPALRGEAALGPDILVDNEGLFAVREPPPMKAFGDLSSIVADLPRDLRFARGLHAGRLDTWNPLVGTGEPLWAEQGGPLFPLKLPFLLAPSIRTWDLFRLSRLPLAALGLWLLARRRGLSSLSSMAAGLSFELCGALASQLSFGATSPVYLLPWALVGAEAIVRAPSRGSVAGAALALGLAGSGGHPSLILLVFVAFAAVIAGQSLRHARHPRRALAIAAAGAGAALLGLSLGAVFSLPLAELLAEADSYKDSGRNAMVLEEWLGRTRRLATAALLSPARILEARTREATDLPFGIATYLGAPALGLALLGLLAGGLDAGLLSCALVGLALAVAPTGLGLLRELPGLRVVLPPYAWPLAALPVCVACGHGVALVEGKGRRVLGRLEERWPRLARQGPALLAAALVATILVTQARALAPLFRDPPSRVLREPPSPGIRALARELEGGGRLLGLPLAIGYPNTPSLFDLPDVRALSALPSRRLRTYLSLTGPTPALLTTHAVGTLHSPLLDLADVRMLVRPRGSGRLPVPPTADEDDQTRLVFHDTYLMLYRNLAAAGRAFVVHEVDRVDSMEIAASRLRVFGTARGHARELGLLSRAFVEAPAGTVIPVAEPPEGAFETVRAGEARDPGRVILEATLSAPGVVVVTDAWAPGWHASVDGRPAPLYPADVLFRAVPVPAGRHLVELRYRPRAFHRGLALSLLALLVTLALLATRRR